MEGATVQIFFFFCFTRRKSQAEEEEVKEIAQNARHAHAKKIIRDM